MLKIAASILSADFSRLAEEVRDVEQAGADLLHIDVMDGHFVPNLSIGPMVVKSIRDKTKLPFYLHLMVENPQLFIGPYIDAGADAITIHVENFRGIYSTIKSIRKRGVKVGVALNPPTPLHSITYLLHDLDLILLMSVDPGFGGQTFIPQILPKIRKARQLIREQGLDIDLAVDGGVNEKTIRSIIHEGANILVMGSTIFRRKDVFSAISNIKEMISLI